MRGLNDRFMADLKGGELTPYLDLIKTDNTLDLEIRENKINIYYRGGRMYEIRLNRRHTDYSYKFDIDKKYAGYSPYSSIIEDMLLNRRYFEAIPYLKTAIDYKLAVARGVEREMQQIIARENNIASAKGKNASVARGTDYYVVDIEYPFPTKGEIDIIAIKYGTKTRSRTVGQLALIELKYGIGALDNNSGIAEHIEQVNRFLSDNGRTDTLKQEAVAIFKQKHELGLMDAAKPVESIDDTKLELILMLASVTPTGGQIRGVLKPYIGKKFEHFDLKVAVASVTGYGLYSKCVMSVDEFFDKYQWMLK